MEEKSGRETERRVKRGEERGLTSIVSSMGKQGRKGVRVLALCKAGRGRERSHWGPWYDKQVPGRWWQVSGRQWRQ